MIINRTPKFLLLSALIAGITSQTAIAQMSAPAGVSAGSGYLYPVLDSQIFYDDNLFNGVSGTQRDTWGFLVSPNLTWDTTNNRQRFAVNWDLEAAFYDKASDDNYVDNTISGLFEFTPTDRFDGSVRAEYKDTHDPRGTGRAEGVVTGLDQDFDQWHSFTVDGSMGYGAQSTPARVEGDIGYVSKRYDNNLVSTAFRDRDDLMFAGRFFYRVAPRTSLLAEGRYAETDYQLASPISGSLNSDTYKLFGGVTWESTAVTTASIKLGYVKKNFDVATRTDGTGIIWEGNLQFAPRTYSVMNFNTARNLNETDGTGDFIQSDSISFDWTHEWSGRVRSVADFSYAKDSFDPTTRKDKRFSAGVSVNYELQRWVTVGGGYHYEDRSSNRDEFDYNRNIWMLTATFSL